MLDIKLGLVIEHFDPYYGGVERWTFNFGKYLLNHIKEIHVICCFYEKVDGITYHIFDKDNNKIKRAENCNKVIENLNLDIVQDMGVGSNFDIFRPGYGSRYGEMEGNIRHLNSIYWFFKKIGHYIFPRYYQLSNLMDMQYSNLENKKIIAVSDMVKNDLINYNKVDPNKIIVMYNGIDTEKFKPDKNNKIIREKYNLGNKIVFLFVGNDFHRKNLNLVIQSFELLNNIYDNIHLLIVGKDKAWNNIYNKNITFVGKTQNIIDYYQNSDVFVFPSFYDPCSNVSMEAMGSGLPVILSPYDGSSFRVEDYKEGFVLKNILDSIELFKKMEILLDDNKRTNMSNNARNLALKYDFDIVNKKWLNIFNYFLKK